MRADYLGIPYRYLADVAPLGWAERGDAIEYGSGETFALAGEIRLLLEGFTSQRPLIHFGHILHFMSLLRRGKTKWHDYGALHRAWSDAGRPARTTGVLAARLCREVPPVPLPPDLPDMPIEVYFRLQFHLPEELAADDPPLDPEVFEACVAAELEGYSYDELLHWLRHGAPPLEEAGENLAESLLDAKPRSLAAALAEASRHDRLCGAVPLVDRLVGALSLPPRRLAEPELPMGGYSDVTTRGQPEQVLAAQFALDELEFLRRHAERELLYYRREEPTSRTREEVVVLLDQGARTWGRVRLALAACVFALGRLAEKRRLAFRIATTGNGGVAEDPRTLPSAELAKLLAGSDLSLTPALALEALLEASAEGPRDVVVLTHPRNVAGPDVAAAARRLPRGWRLFGVGVSSAGDVGFSELVRGLPVTLSKFRLDLDAPPPPPPTRAPAGQGWTGDVEPIGFPFRFGVASSQERMLFAFDHEGEHLLVSATGGVLMAMAVDGSRYEMLPRSLVRGQVVADVQQLIGVAGGFVVILGAGEGLAAAHYALAERRCRVYEFALPSGSRGDVEWRYLRRKHALLLRCGEAYSWLLLHTGLRTEPYPKELRWLPAATSGGSDYRPLPFQDTSAPTGREGRWRIPGLIYHSLQGTLWLEDVEPAWQTFTPLANGIPVLRNLKLSRAECRQHTLAVLFTRPDYHKQLFLFRGPGGTPIGTLGLPFENDTFALSSDGRLLAVQRGSSQVQVREVQPGLGIRAATPLGRFHNNVVVELGEKMLWLSIDRTTHWLRWETGELIASLAQEPPPGRGGPPRSATRALPGRVPGFLRHDRWRFRLAAWRTLIAVVSVFGEVFLFEQTGDLVCAFFAFRQSLAAWMPDGTCAGPESLLGQKPWADASRRIGRALLEAWERGEGTTT